MIEEEDKKSNVQSNSCLEDKDQSTNLGVTDKLFE